MSSLPASSTSALDREQVLARRYHFTRPGRYWLLAASILWIAGVSKGMNIIAFMSYLMLVVWTLNLCLAGRRFRNLSVRVTCRPPEAVHAGEPFKLEVEVTNHGRRAIESVDIEMHGAEHQAFGFVDLEPGSARFQTRITAWRRGWYHFEPLRLRSGFPFGLVERVARAEELDGVLVYPPLGELEPDKLLHALSACAGHDGVRARRAAGREEFRGLREFRAGDSLRWVHWRTSARRGSLMVKECDDRANRDLIVVLDPYLPAGEMTRPQQQTAELNLEHAVSLAATICDTWCHEAGSQLVLAIAGPDFPVIVGGETSPGHGPLYLEALTLASGSEQIDTGNLVKQLAERLPRAPVLLVSARPQGLEAELTRGLGCPVLTLQAGAGLAAECYRPPQLPLPEARS